MNVAIALATAYTPRTARIAHSATLQIRYETYIEAARALGVPTRRILARGIFPNILPALIVQQTFVFAYAILGETGLSFVGVGIQPPVASWGNIVGDARAFIREAPWMVFFPGAAIMVLVLSLNLLGDGLREVLDPKRRR
jgi:peptide/nickel transport system permease protein